MGSQTARQQTAKCFPNAGCTSEETAWRRGHLRRPPVGEALLARGRNLGEQRAGGALGRGTAHVEAKCIQGFWCTGALRLCGAGGEGEAGVGSVEGEMGLGRGFRCLLVDGEGL